MLAYKEVRSAIEPTLKAKAYEALAANGVSISDYIRSALINLVETGNVPFPIKKALPGKQYPIAARQQEVAAQV